MFVDPIIQQSQNLDPSIVVGLGFYFWVTASPNMKKAPSFPFIVFMISLFNTSGRLDLVKEMLTWVKPNDFLTSSTRKSSG